MSCTVNQEAAEIPIIDHETLMESLCFFLGQQGVVSGALIFLRLDMELSSLESEIIVSSTVLAAAIAAWFGHSLLDNYGRKRTLVFASVIFVIGSVVMALGDYVILIIGRIIVGVAIGFASEAGTNKMILQ